MIAPTQQDIGRMVVYRPRPDAVPQQGTLSSLARVAGCCFVRFNGPNGELTRCQDLEWICHDPDPLP